VFPKYPVAENNAPHSRMALTTRSASAGCGSLPAPTNSVPTNKPAPRDVTNRKALPIGR